MKNLGTRNLVIDLLLMVDLALISGIGILMKHALPPGRDRILRFGDNRELYFLGLDRHQWGTIHLVAGCFMLGLLILHLVFHWKTLECLVRNAVPRRPLRRALALLFILLSGGLFIFGFIIRPEHSGQEIFLYRNRQAGVITDPIHLRSLEEDAEVPERTTERPEPRPSGKEPDNLDGGRSGSDTEHTNDRRILGSMSLEEAAGIFGISAGEAKRRLGLPDGVSGWEQMGRLRRLYGFTMSEAEERMKEKR